MPTYTPTRTIHRALLAAFAAGLAILSACDELAEGTDEPVAALTQAVTITTTCSPDALTSPAGRCQGPWSYKRWKTCSMRHLECDAQCLTWKSCQHYANGMTATSRRETEEADLETCVVERHGNFLSPVCRPATGSNSESRDRFCVNSLKKTALTRAFEARVNTQTFLNATAKNRALTDGRAMIRATGTLVESDSPPHGMAEGTTWTVVGTCTWQLVDAVAKSARSESCGCENMGHEMCSQQHPDCGTELFHTKPGETKPALTKPILRPITTTGPFGGTITINLPFDLEVYTEQACTTHDDMPFETSAQVRAKFDKLRAEYESPPPLEDATKNPAGQITLAKFKQAIAARLQLLHELRAQLLEVNRRTFVRATYADAANTTCRAPVNLSTACLEKVKAANLYQRLQVCAGFADHWTTGTGDKTLQTASAALYIDHCLSGFDDSASTALTDETCRGELRDAVSARVASLMRARFSYLAWDGEQLDKLDEALGAIDGWYEHLVRAAPITGVTAEVAQANLTWQRRETSDLLGNFWTRVQEVSSALPLAVDGSIDTDLDRLSGDGLLTDMAVLNGIFRVAFDSPPILSLFHDALRVIVDRLEVASELHDLACRYRACAPGSANLTAQAWRLLAAIPDRVGLAQAVTDASLLREAGHDLRNAVLDAFEMLSGEVVWNRLGNAYLRDGNSGTLGELLVADELSPAAAGVAAIVRKAKERYWSYQQAEGLFMGNGGRRLELGLQNTGSVVQTIAARFTEYSSALDSWTSKRLQLVKDLVDELTLEQQDAVTGNRMQLIAEQIGNATSQISALRRAEDEDQAAWSNMAESFMKASAHLADVVADSVPLTSLSLSGADNGFANVTDAHGIKQFWEYEIQAGEMLQFTVTDEYAPNCALKEATLSTGELGRLRAPGTGQDYDVTNTDQLIGPDGYRMTFTGTTFETTSKERETSLNAYTNTETCTKVGFTSGVWGKVYMVEADSWVKACMGASASVTDSYGGSAGADARNQASFSGGIHLSGTPYPDAPAGALLLVANTPGHDADVVALQVVGRNSVYLADRAVRVRLLVNDSYCADADTTSKIAVQVVRHTPTQLMLGEIAAAMTLAVQEVTNRRETLISQGGMVPSEDSYLRDRVRANVESKTHRTIAKLPPPVQDFLALWTDSAILSLYRHLEIARREREITVGMLELDGLERERALGQKRSRLQSLLPRWQLRELRADHLALPRLRLYHDLRELVPPILEIRYRPWLARLLGNGDFSAVAELIALENIDFTEPMHLHNETLRRLGSKVVAALTSAVADPREYGGHTVAISFPRPERYSAIDLPTTCPEGDTCTPPGLPPPTTWSPAGYSRADALWDAIYWDTFQPKLSPMAHIAITPADLYFPGGHNGRLNCYEAAPFIRKMAIYVVGPPASNLGFMPDITIGRDQIFPFANGLGSYAMPEEDDELRVSKLPILSGGESAGALTALELHDSATFVGLSPFNTFDINMQTFRGAFSSMSGINEIVLVFRLDGSGATAPVHASPCQPTPPPASGN
jgi:hypothetical protein